MSKVFDISIGIGNGLGEWPGYKSTKIDVASILEEPGGYYLTEISMLTQSGTHIDAPMHFSEGCASIDEVPFDVFLGVARLIDLSHLDGECISVKDCERSGEWPKRVIVKTRASNSWENGLFPTSYPVFDEESIEYLKSKGVQGVVTDAPSVDLFDSKAPLVHLWLQKSGIYIMESAFLSRVPEGYYELIALPLKIYGADGSPVRAVLRELE